MSIQTAITRIQALIDALDAVQYAPDEIPDQTGLYPFVIAYPGQGTWESVYGATGYKHLGTVNIELYASPVDHGENAAIQAIVPLLESIPKALLGDPTLNATVDTMTESMTVSDLMILQFGSVRYFGVRWTLSYKQEGSLS